MTPNEAGQLLAHAAAFDNRQPSPIAAKAWASALHDVPLDQDALDAVSAYYSADGTPGERRWLMPFHVRHYRAQARAERIRAANLVYDGNPLETGAQSISNLRQLIRAAGDGRIGERTARQAIPDRRPLELEAGPQGRLEQALAGIGAKPPRQVAGVANPLAVGCPHCQATPGRSCTSTVHTHRKRSTPHPARTEHARRIAAGTSEAS
jgi:hypothetical protein